MKVFPTLIIWIVILTLTTLMISSNVVSGARSSLSEHKNHQHQQQQDFARREMRMSGQNIKPNKNKKGQKLWGNSKKGFKQGKKGGNNGKQKMHDYFQDVKPVWGKHFRAPPRRDVFYGRRGPARGTKLPTCFSMFC
ncbi:unnamed protein product [Amaranthus hypochondriacus]